MNSLDKSGTQQGHQDKVHTVQTSVDTAIAAADNGLVAAEHFAHPTIAEIRVPGRSDARAERTVEREIRVFLPGAGIAYEGKADLRVVDLSIQSRSFSLFKIGR